MGVLVLEYIQEGKIQTACAVSPLADPDQLLLYAYSISESYQLLSISYRIYPVVGAD